MATGRVRAGFLHTRAQPAGQDPQPGPGPNINRVFFFRGPDPPRWPRLTFGPKSGPTDFFFLKPIELFFARLKPIHWAANLSPFKALLVANSSPFKALLGSQFKPIHWATNKS